MLKKDKKGALMIECSLNGCHMQAIYTAVETGGSYSEKNCVIKLYFKLDLLSVQLLSINMYNIT